MCDRRWLTKPSCRKCTELQFAPAFEGTSKGHFVGGFERAARRQAEADAGNRHTERLELLGQIMGGGIAFNFGAEGQDDFGWFLQPDPLDERGNAEVLRANAIERRDAPQQRVIDAGKTTGALQRQNVVRTFDNADQGVIPTRVGANFTQVEFGVVAAPGTVVNV